MLKKHFNNHNPSIDDLIEMFLLNTKSSFINMYDKINVTLSNKSEDIL